MGLKSLHLIELTLLAASSEEKKKVTKGVKEKKLHEQEQETCPNAVLSASSPAALTHM